MVDQFNALTPQQTASLFAAIALSVLLLHALICIIWRNGICPLPGFMMFGFWGSAPTSWLIFVASDHKNNEALIAHERCHQSQQRRDGTLTFWWRYSTDKTARMEYEVEAYRVWVQVAPNDLSRCVWSLTKSYNFDLTNAQAIELLTSKPRQ